MKSFKQFMEALVPKYTAGPNYPKDLPFIKTPFIKRKGLEIWKFNSGAPRDFVKKKTKKDITT
tara:strand:+ start:9504 stop:9692 length:189 start_codon:yes stop_codon:yes gene_type:complete